MKKNLLTIAVAIGSLNAHAQTDVVAVVNTTEPPKEPKIEHIIGVQANALIRQVFNFNNSTSNTVNNPYLLNYTLRFKKSGIGIRAGAGYSNSVTSTDDGITQSTSNLNDMQLRLGIEKAFALSKRWSTGVGIDGLLNVNNDETNSKTLSFDTTTTHVKTDFTTYGGGAMAWLRYNITDKIQIGTEASFYYTTGRNKQTITTTSPQFQPQIGQTVNTTTVTPVDNKQSQGVFSSPVVFFLMIRF